MVALMLTEKMKDQGRRGQNWKDKTRKSKRADKKAQTEKLLGSNGKNFLSLDFDFDAEGRAQI